MTVKAKVTNPEGWKVFEAGKTLTFPRGATLEGEYAELALSTRDASRIFDKPAKKSQSKKVKADE